MSVVLYDLLNEKDSFKWKHEHRQGFDAIFDNRNNAVFVDAGNTAYKMDDRGGMCAILAQKYKDGWRLIYFASRRLTDVESR